MVSTGTYLKKQHLHTSDRLTLVRDRLFEVAEEFGWRLQAWAILSNHYHFVALSPAEPHTLSRMLSKLHTTTAIDLNKRDNQAGRRVWYQFFDSHITYERSFFARLKYVHWNPQHHGIIANAENYPWCSAAWLARNASSAMFQTIKLFKTDQLNVVDGYRPLAIDLGGGDGASSRPE